MACVGGCVVAAGHEARDRCVSTTSIKAWHAQQRHPFTSGKTHANPAATEAAIRDACINHAMRALIKPLTSKQRQPPGAVLEASERAHALLRQTVEQLGHGQGLGLVVTTRTVSMAMHSLLKALRVAGMGEQALSLLAEMCLPGPDGSEPHVAVSNIMLQV